MTLQRHVRRSMLRARVKGVEDVACLPIAPAVLSPSQREAGTNSNHVNQEWIRQQRRPLFREARAASKNFNDVSLSDAKPKRVQLAMKAVSYGLHTIIQEKHVIDAFTESLQEAGGTCDDGQLEAPFDEAKDEPPTHELLLSQVSELFMTLQGLSNMSSVSELMFSILASTQTCAELLRHLHESSAVLVDGWRVLDSEIAAQAEKVCTLMALISVDLARMKKALQMSLESSEEVETRAPSSNHRAHVWLDPPAHCLYALGVIEKTMGTLSKVAQDIELGALHTLPAKAQDLSVPALEGDIIMDSLVFQWAQETSQNVSDTCQLEEVSSSLGKASKACQLEETFNGGENTTGLLPEPPTADAAAGMPLTTNTTVQHCDSVESTKIATLTPGTANALPAVPDILDSNILDEKPVEHTVGMVDEGFRAQGKEMRSRASTPEPGKSHDKASHISCTFEVLKPDTRPLPLSWQTRQRAAAAWHEKVDDGHLPPMEGLSRKEHMLLERIVAKEPPRLAGQTHRRRHQSASASPDLGRRLSDRKLPQIDTLTTHWQPTPPPGCAIDPAPRRRKSLEPMDLPTLLGRKSVVSR